MITESHRQLVLKSLRTHRPLVVKTHTFLPEVQDYTDEVLRLFLKELGVERLADQLSFCLRELAVNAKKANTKRIYFREKGLDPADPDQYSAGMAGFKRDTLSDQAAYLTKLKDEGLYVKIELFQSDGRCSVAVRNNVRALPAETARVNAKVALSARYHTLEDAFGEVLDESEGAGLGIVVLLLMLRNLGFSGRFFRFFTSGDETVARIHLPFSLD